MVIAIDGLGVNGKSTLAKMISKKLNFQNFNTGAIYRCIALKIINEKLDINNILQVIDRIKDIDIYFDNGKTYQDGKDVSKEIRSEQISVCSTQWATIPEIKETVKSNDVEIDVIKITDNANNNLKKNNFYNGEAMDALDNASKVFHTPNNYADDENKLPDNLKNIINRYKDFDTIDLVIVLDTTESMHPYIRSIKKEIRGIARQLFDNHKKARIGFMLYRDVKDTYFTKMIDFSDNMNLINREVNYFFASGGGDKAEPMYEAIQEALEKFNFVHNKKLIIVITDSPAKVIVRANLDLNAKTAREKDVTIELVLTSEIEEEDTSDDHLYFLNF